MMIYRKNTPVYYNNEYMLFDILLYSNFIIGTSINFPDYVIEWSKIYLHIDDKIYKPNILASYRTFESYVVIEWKLEECHEKISIDIEYKNNNCGQFELEQVKLPNNVNHIFR